MVVQGQEEGTQYPALVLVEEKKSPKPPFIIKMYPFKSSVDCLAQAITHIKHQNSDFL